MSADARRAGAAAADARRAGAAAGVTQALERLCDTHAGVRVAPAVQALNLQVKALQDQVAGLQKTADQRARSLQDHVEGAWRQLEGKTGKLEERILPTLESLGERMERAENLLESKTTMLATHLAQTGQMLENKLGEQANTVAECANLCTLNQKTISGLEERVDAFREYMVETGARIQKVEVASSQADKISKRIMALAEELEPFAQELQKVQLFTKELQKTIDGHSATLTSMQTTMQTTMQTSIDQAHSAIGDITGILEPLPGQQEALDKRIGTLESEHQEAYERFKQLALSVASILDEQTTERTASSERWQQLDSTLSTLVSEVHTVTKTADATADALSEAIPVLQESIDAKCDSTKFEELAEIVAVLQGEVESGSRKTAKFAAALGALEGQKLEDLTSALAGIVAKVSELEQGLEDKVSKPTFQQVKTTLVNIGTQLNELKRDRDVQAIAGQPQAAPAGGLELMQSKLLQFEGALHAKADKTEVGEITVALNKVQRKSQALEEQQQHATPRLEQVETATLRVNGAMDSISGRMTHVENTVSTSNKRMAELQAAISAKVDFEDSKEIERAMADCQSRVAGLTLKTEQIDADVKSKASTSQLQTLASTLGSLTSKFSETGARITECVTFSQEAKQASQEARQAVNEGLSQAASFKDFQAFQEKSQKAMDQSFQKKSQEFEEAFELKCETLRTKVTEVDFALNSKVDLSYFESTMGRQAQPPPPFQPPAREGT